MAMRAEDSGPAVLRRSALGTIEAPAHKEPWQALKVGSLNGIVLHLDLAVYNRFQVMTHGKWEQPKRYQRFLSKPSTSNRPFAFARRRLKREVAVQINKWSTPTVAQLMAGGNGPQVLRLRGPIG